MGAAIDVNTTRSRRHGLMEQLRVLLTDADASVASLP
jgi:hypothetical protein